MNRFIRTPKPTFFTSILLAVLIGLAAVAPVQAGIGSAQTVSVCSVRNQTAGLLYYQIRWPGGEWKSFELQAARANYHWFPGTGVQCEIRFDRSFDPGYQEKRGWLTTKDFRGDGISVKPTKVQHGLIYDFRLTPGNTGVKLVCETPLHKGNLTGERFVIDGLHEKDGRDSYPNLFSNYEVDAPATGPATKTRSYNCIAWSLGITDRWVWPGATIADFDRLYGGKGYERSKTLDYRVLPGVAKIVLYGKTRPDGRIECTHAARQEKNGTWTSKLGGLARIRHLVPDDLAGPSYGHPVAVYYRPM